ncbi:MAG: hypothetical protein PHI48_07140 [Bacteroidales bacterium]|nr:hypothetical protein [Bacteroidales bacterium]
MNDSIRKILRLPIKTPIEYWEKYWSYFTEKLGEEGNYEVTLDSPRFLIDNIISEIEYNNLKNKDNSQLFKDQLSEWDNKDAVFNDLFHDNVTSLQQKWDEFFQQVKNQKKENRKTYCKHILSLCKQINAEFNKGTYFDGLLKKLISTITNAQTLDYDTKKEINKYTELIISEFIANGFDIDDIKSIQHDIPDILRIEGGTVSSAPNTYKGLNREDYDNKKSYHKAIEDYIEKRSIEERISILSDYYNIEPKDCFVLFRLKGIKGFTNCMIDDINIYDPHLKQYIAETPTFSKIEQTTSDRKVINAAIPVKHKMLRSSVSYAKQRLEHVIDLLSLSFNTSAPIKYSDRDVSIVENGRCIGGINLTIGDEATSSKHQEFVGYMKSLDVSPFENDLAEIDERFTFIHKNPTCDTLKLATAAHWYQKGKYPKKTEDKLLFHWVAIESLLKTDVTIGVSHTENKEANNIQTKTVQKIAASIIVKSFFYNYWFNTYTNIYNNTQFNNNFFDIPEVIIEKASLNMKVGDKVHINKFFNHIKEIEENINDEILKTKLHELNSFYKNKDGINKKEKEIFNDIILIYRLRNLIAHNAVYPQYLIGIYANKAQNISGSIIRALIERLRTSNRGLDEILIDVSSKYDEFILNIDNEILKLKD